MAGIGQVLPQEPPQGSRAESRDQGCAIDDEPMTQRGFEDESGARNAQSGVEAQRLEEPRTSAYGAQPSETGIAADGMLRGADAIGFSASGPQTATQIGPQWPAAAVGL